MIRGGRCLRSRLEVFQVLAVLEASSTPVYFPEVEAQYTVLLRILPLVHNAQHHRLTMKRLGHASSATS